MSRAARLFHLLASLGAVLISLRCAGAPGPVPAPPVSPPHAPPAARPRPSPAEPLPFWLGRWHGSFAGTQEYVTLDVLPGGRFRCSWQQGPDQTCLAQGSVRASDRRFELAVEQTDCAAAGSALWEYPDIWASAPGVVLLTRSGLERHIGTSVDNQLVGPLWVLARESVRRESSAE